MLRRVRSTLPVRCLVSCRWQRLTAAVLLTVLTIGLLALPTFAQAPAPPVSQEASPAPNGDVFGEEVMLMGRPIVFIADKASWANAFPALTQKFKVMSAFLSRQKLKPAGSMMTIYTTATDQIFEFQVAVPLAEAPTGLPRGVVIAGQSPIGKALKFVHHGSYDSMEMLYEAIRNHLDEKRLERQGPYIEEYVTDPLTTPEDKLVVNVFVLVK